MSIKFNNNFAHDLEIGQQYEGMFANILRGKTLEIKTDLLAHKTGNIAIEYEYREKPSGIAKTTADYWAYILPNAEIKNIILLMETSQLKHVARELSKHPKNIRCGGDDNASKMVLVPIQRLIRDVITSN